ncbi:low molecular weight phosphatase family protein [Cellulosimicrobium sp. NPDC055967]|uniref:arsenate reductase/protein-tyrosine-phosphatase family protein n=1 Tax=Cellulosimicrobium sp. NPDC055967 TaxID=3345670 RepID=UPI0035E00217
MLSVLVVCTGNICRSPAAQLVLGAALDDSVVVASAGTGAVVGAPVAPVMARLLSDRGLDPSGFVARSLTEDLVRSGDLVLTMTRRHRAAVLELAPSALRRTFLVTELVSIAERLGTGAPGADDAARLADVAAAAPRARASLDLERDAPDVEDPYGRSEDVYRRVLDRIEADARRLVAALRG